MMALQNSCAKVNVFGCIPGLWADQQFSKGFRMVCFVGPHFWLLASSHAQVRLIADASDPNTAKILTHATAIVNDYQQEVMRMVMPKGSGLSDIRFQIYAMLGFAVFLMAGQF